MGQVGKKVALTRPSCSVLHSLIQEPVVVSGECGVNCVMAGVTCVLNILSGIICQHNLQEEEFGAIQCSFIPAALCEIYFMFLLPQASPTQMSSDPFLDYQNRTKISLDPIYYCNHSLYCFHFSLV